MDVESAGTSFALSVLKAEQYHGQEIGSTQVLIDNDLVKNNENEKDISVLGKEAKIDIKNCIQKIFFTYEKQYNGWKSMNVFEKQWIFRDFKKEMALSVEQAYDILSNISKNVNNNDYTSISKERTFLRKLKEYWEHQLKLLRGYEKNKVKLEENTRIIQEYIYDLEKIL